MLYAELSKLDAELARIVELQEAVVTAPDHGSMWAAAARALHALQHVAIEYRSTKIARGWDRGAAFNEWVLAKPEQRTITI